MMGKGTLKSDPRRALEFLKSLYSNGPWVLTAIHPAEKGGVITETLESDRAVEQFVQKHNKTSNVYYSVNPVKGKVTKKAAKTDIASAAYLHVDADPDDGESPELFKERILPKIEAHKPAPTFVVNSGNGVNLLWRLDAPVTLNGAEDWEDIEARNAGLAKQFEADPSTKNIDRILRLPATVNYPTAKKRKIGRIPCMASLIELNDEKSYPLSQFKPAKEKKQKSTAPRVDCDVQKLPRDLQALLFVPGPGSYPSRSELVYAFVHRALRVGVDANDIVAAMLDPTYRGNGIFEHIAENGGEACAKRQIEHAMNDAGATPDENKVIIRPVGGDTDAMWRKTEQALIKAKCPLFYRGGELVLPLWRWEKTIETNREALSLRLVPIKRSQLSDMVQHHAAIFQKQDGRRSDDKWKNIDPPKPIIEALLEAGHWTLPTIAGITNSPTMRPDGSLLIEPGYDPVTKLYYKPGSDVGLPPIPERPTKEQAESTLRLLSSLLDGFPFDGEGNKVQKRSVSRSVALAGIMTTVLRGAFRATPIFLFLAPEPGTGKTFLVKVISYIATGRAVPGSTGCENKEEMDKRLTADVREAPPILHLNNINFDIESPLLSEITTEGIAKIRPLGKTERVPCDCTGMTVFINGNNIRVVGELVRRTLVSMIDAKMERPETRTFDFDPIELVQKDRGAYLAAVFTIARAYMAAGCPEVKGETLAGYEQWSKLVQHPLIWLGMDDPLLSTDEARKLDPEREGLRARIDALVNCFGVEKEFTASEINQTATELQTDGLLGQHRFRHPDLLDAFSREGKPMSSKTIGNQLMKDRERRSNNYYIAIATESGKTRNSYKIVDTDLERAKRGETM